MQRDMGRIKKKIIDIGCPYTDCVLPASNWKFYIQGMVVWGCFWGLLKNQDEFTFFPIILFVLPELLDISGSKLKGRLFKIVKIAIYGTDFIILSFCICGLAGFLANEPDKFVVLETAIILPNYWISKYIIIPFLIPSLLAPWVLGKASPTKQTAQIEASLSGQSKTGVQS